MILASHRAHGGYGSSLSFSRAASSSPGSRDPAPAGPRLGEYPISSAFVPDERRDILPACWKLAGGGHSITWSARPSSDCGMVSPSVLGGLEIDDQLELGGLLDGEVGGLGAFEDLVHVGGGTSYLVVEVHRIRHETARLDELAMAPHASVSDAWRQGPRWLYGAQRSEHPPLRKARGRAPGSSRQRRSRTPPLRAPRTVAMSGPVPAPPPAVASVPGHWLGRPDCTGPPRGTPWVSLPSGAPSASRLVLRYACHPRDVPPGRAKLPMSPAPTASAMPAKTMGIVLVACFAEREAGVLGVTITSGLRRTSSAASSGSRSTRPLANRYSQW